MFETHLEAFISSRVCNLVTLQDDRSSFKQLCCFFLYLLFSRFQLNPHACESSEMHRGVSLGGCGSQRSFRTPTGTDTQATDPTS